MGVKALNAFSLLLGLSAVVAAVGALASGVAAHPELILKDGQSYSAPFHSGEKLVYDVHWKPLFVTPAFKAGEISLDIQKSRYGRKDTFTISAWAISNGSLPRIAGIDVSSYFESMIDRENFRSYRVLKKSRRGKRKRNVEILFDYHLDRTVVREVDLAFNPPNLIRDEVISGIPGPLSDVLSIFYVARLRVMKIGDQYSAHLSDSGKHRKIQVRVEKRENVQTRIGEFQSLKVATEGGFFRGGGDFRVWYSEDSLRVPVKFEAEAKFGKLYGQIIQLQAEGTVRGLIKTTD